MFRSDSQRKAMFANMFSAGTDKYKMLVADPNSKLRTSFDDYIISVGEKWANKFGSELTDDRKTELKSIALDYIDLAVDNNDEYKEFLAEKALDDSFNAKYYINSELEDQLSEEVRDAVIPFDSVNVDAFDSVSDEISTLNTYGVRDVTPEEDSFRFAWSNGARSWYVAGNVKAGESTRLDANEFVYPKSEIGSSEDAFTMSVMMPELPLYYGSTEAGSRGEVTMKEKFDAWRSGKPEIVVGSEVVDKTAELFEDELDSPKTMVVPKSFKYKKKIDEVDDVQE